MVRRPRILQASLAELQQVDGIGPKLSAAIVEHRNADAAIREIERCRQANIRLLRKATPEYPRMLTQICDPPSVLYCRGRLEPRDEVAVAIVGSRRCSVYGRQQAERFAGALARAGATVISGLARGIDAAAHRGALEAGGRTIAVAATGLAKVYPPEHKELAAQIAEQGGVVSESCLDQEPIAGLFPQRNRIISGMSLGVIIIEATRTSGALHTARHALEQGREVFALPGRIDSLTSEGCHDLIRDGVPLVRGVDDVLEALGPLLSPVKRTETESVHSPRELTSQRAGADDPQSRHGRSAIDRRSRPRFGPRIVPRAGDADGARNEANAPPAPGRLRDAYGVLNHVRLERRWEFFQPSRCAVSVEPASLFAGRQTRRTRTMCRA